MAFKNVDVKGAKMAGTPKQGDSNADANMPANNFGTFPVKMGSGNSKFGVGVNVNKVAQKPAIQSAKGDYVNMPANNNTEAGIPLGTTHHSVGTVPAYLRGGKTGAPR